MAAAVSWKFEFLESMQIDPKQMRRMQMRCMLIKGAWCKFQCDLQPTTLWPLFIHSGKFGKFTRVFFFNCCRVTNKSVVKLIKLHSLLTEVKSESAGIKWGRIYKWIFENFQKTSRIFELRETSRIFENFERLRESSRIFENFTLKNQGKWLKIDTMELWCYPPNEWASHKNPEASCENPQVSR